MKSVWKNSDFHWKMSGADTHCLSGYSQDPASSLWTSSDCSVWCGWSSYWAKVRVSGHSCGLSSRVSRPCRMLHCSSSCCSSSTLLLACRLVKNKPNKLLVESTVFAWLYRYRSNCCLTKSWILVAYANYY